jgi:hypothetical protein
MNVNCGSRINGEVVGRVANRRYWSNKSLENNDCNKT